MCGLILIAVSLTIYCKSSGSSTGTILLTPMFPTPTLKNWGLNNAGNSHIDAIKAWSISEGRRNIIVAVIDTGIDPNHKDIVNNLWHDPEHPEIYGWNFVSNQANPKDEHGHGTHVAGIIGATLNTNVGVSGVAHKVSIMPIKYYSDANPGSINLKNTIKAINYAIDHHANIINYSGGGPEFSEDEYLAFRRAEVAGILVVAAAGNEHQDTDKTENYYYPAAYHLSNIIVVASSDIRNNRVPSSNWGQHKVDVSAPGENIFSTLPGGRYGYMTGTSQATPFVSGIATLMLACDPTLKPTQVKQLIVASVNKFPQQEKNSDSGGIVNANNAMQALLKLKGHCSRQRP